MKRNIRKRHLSRWNAQHTSAKEHVQMIKSSQSQFKHGSQNENWVQEIAEELLDGVEEAWLSESGSDLDVRCKVDLVIEPVDLVESKNGLLVQNPEVKCWTVQIKSTKEQAIEFVQNTPDTKTVDGIMVPRPPVLVAVNGPAILSQLEKITGLPRTQAASAAIEVAKGAKQGAEVPAIAFSPTVRQALRILNLCKFQGNTLIF